jgi:hypothetical protein
MNNKIDFEPRKIEISINIEGFPFHTVADGYFHPELEEEILYADEIDRIESQIEKFKKLINGLTSETNPVSEKLNWFNNTALPIEVSVST